MQKVSFAKTEPVKSFKGSIVILNKAKFLEKIEEFEKIQELEKLRNELLPLQNIINFSGKDREGLININADGDTLILRRDILSEEINQIQEAFTIERAKYYLKRLEDGVKRTRTNKINDINLSRWKEYDEIITNSLWVLDKRGSSGAHLGWYWGNFIPQIPHQMMLRYTKKGDWVLDAFVGSGTTLIECKRLGRNGIGIELNSEVAEKARTIIDKEPNKHNTIAETITGDSRTININSALSKNGKKNVQLLIMHPPYYDIIKFTNEPNDLSRAPTIESFLKMFGEVVDNTYPFLENKRYFALVIGDKYSKGEWIPLGFYCMNEVLKRGYLLKSIIVKNFEETRAKRNQKELWRYRALVGGFYIFKHEYIMLFKKKEKR